MRRPLIAAAGLVLVAALGAGCDPEPGPGTKDRQPPATPDASTVAANVRNLCDFFYTRPLEVLGTPQAEGNVTFLAGQPGIPAVLRTDAIGYYDGGFGGRPDTDERRQILERRYSGIITDCRRAGWLPA